MEALLGLVMLATSFACNSEPLGEVHIQVARVVPPMRQRVATVEMIERRARKHYGATFITEVTLSGLEGSAQMYRCKSEEGE
jgi:hypothetical protein